MSFVRVHTKAMRRMGRVIPSKETRYEVEIRKDNSITIRDTESGDINLFHVGDHAEYDSYNLSYYGPILKIGPKTVSIICRHDYDKYSRGEKVQVHRLDLYKFCSRNIKFDLDKITASNHVTSHAI